MDMAVDHDADNYYADSDKNFEKKNNIILCRILRTLVNKPHIKNGIKILTLLICLQLKPLIAIHVYRLLTSFHDNISGKKLAMKNCLWL